MSVEAHPEVFRVISKCSDFISLAVKNLTVGINSYNILTEKSLLRIINPYTLCVFCFNSSLGRNVLNECAFPASVRRLVIDIAIESATMGELINIISDQNEMEREHVTMSFQIAQALPNSYNDFAMEICQVWVSTLGELERILETIFPHFRYKN